MKTIYCLIFLVGCGGGVAPPPGFTKLKDIPAEFRGEFLMQMKIDKTGSFVADQAAKAVVIQPARVILSSGEVLKVSGVFQRSSETNVTLVTFSGRDFNWVFGHGYEPPRKIYSMATGETQVIPVSTSKLTVSQVATGQVVGGVFFELTPKPKSGEPNGGGNAR